MQNKRKNDEKTSFDFACFMLCGACSKTCATIVAYPHGKSVLYILRILKWSYENQEASWDFLPNHKARHFHMKWNFSVKLNTRYVFAEVARTRLREEGSKYRSFWQTLHAVYQSEGRRGLYRGLATQLIRQIPNTAIMMSTYELTVYVLTKWLKDPQQSISHNSSTS